MVYSLRQKAALEQATGLPVELGMTYGEPSIKSGLEALKARGCEKILVLPLYPQYSGTTTAAVFDKLAKSVKQDPSLPELRFINSYYDENAYIEHWRNQWKRTGHKMANRTCYCVHTMAFRSVTLTTATLIQRIV